MQKKLVTILVAVLLMGFTTQAQQKIAHLNSMDVLQSMPEVKAMNEDLEKKKNEYQALLEKMYTEYEAKQRELQGLVSGPNAANANDAIVEMKAKELQDLQNRIQTFEEKVQGQLQARQMELMKPINDKYLKVVKEVAKEQGISYVIDIVSGAVAYFPEESNDITDAVLTKMGYKRLMNTNLGNAQGTGAAKPAGTK